MDDVARIVAAGTGRPLRYRPLAPEGAREALPARVGPMAGFLAAHYAAVAAGDFAQVTDGVPRLTGRLGRTLAALVAEDRGAGRPPGRPGAAWTCPRIRRRRRPAAAPAGAGRGSAAVPGGRPRARSRP